MKGGKSKAETRRGATSKRKTLLGEEKIWVDNVYTLYNDIRHIHLPFCSESSNSENQKGLDMSIAKSFSLLQSHEEMTCGSEHTDSLNSENQKGLDMSTANCYSLFSSSYNESDGKLLSSNSAEFNGSDMSTLKSCSPFEGLDLDRFMNNVLKKMVIKPIRYEKSSDAPELALEYFKTVKKGGDYEFVDSVLNIPTIDFGCHINFFARLKGKDSPPEFFFAELRAGSPREVVDCCIINPKPYSFGETPPPRLVLTHCKHVNCDECKVWADLKGNGTGQICV